MTEEREKLLKELILEELRGTYLEELGGIPGYFIGQIYADYRDEMDAKTAGAILQSEEPEQTFRERLEEWYWESEIWYKNDLISDVIAAIWSDENEFPDGLTDEECEYIEDFIRDHVGFAFPEDHFLDQDMCVNIMLDTGDCNYDFTLNGVYPCWYGQYREKLDDKAAIVWLAKQQGYTKTQLKKALNEGDMADPRGFLESLRVELANLPSHMSTLTFLVRMTFRDLLALHEAIKWRERQGGRKYDPKEYPYSGYIVLDKRTMCGLFDPWAGGGSVLEIELEKDVRIPVKYIWAAVVDGTKIYGYDVGDVYGMCESAWMDTLKEMHFPKKMKEAI